MNITFYNIKVLACLLLLLLPIDNAWPQKPFVFPKDISPLIETRWGQGHPFNILCPQKQDEEDINQNLAGCGPVAMAQIVNYHRYPSYSPDGKYKYDWGMMYNTLSNSLLKEEVVSVAKLISDCGISSFTEYSDKGSGTSLENLMGALKRLFTYSNNMCLLERDSFLTPQRDSIYRQLIFEELQAGRPVLGRGYNKTENYGHLFIIDGCRKHKVHVNMGWTGHYDSYYDLDDLNNFSQQQCILIEVADSNYKAPVLEVSLTEAGTLASQLNDKERLMTRHIKIGGPMNNADFAVLRSMLNKGLLRTVDMEDADVRILPDSAFFDCAFLSHFVAPRNLQRIGRLAFCRCRNLNYAIFHDRLQIVGGAAFSGCINLLSVRLPATTLKIGHSAFSHCWALLTVTLPEGLVGIEPQAFLNCKNLYSAYLPKTLRKVGRDAFAGCKKLHHIDIAADNPWLEAKGLQIKVKAQKSE